MKTPDHEEYTVVKRYKRSDRKAYLSRRKALLDQRSTFSQKKWAVKQVIKFGRRVDSIAEFIGRNRSTLYRWMKEAIEHGYEALRPKSKRPNRVHTLSLDQVQRVLSAYEEHRCGSEKLAIHLGDISHMSVYRVLVRFGIINKGKTIRRRWRHFERKHPNSMWQIDIKTVSQFPALYTVTIIDDHSRFIVGCDHFDHVPTAADIIAMIRNAIEIYGPPREILTDHGAQFYANRGNGVSSFDLWLDENRIKHILAGVRKPTTIGKVERWHRSMKDELISRVENLDEFRVKLPEFISYYNFKRPHFGYERTRIAKDVWKRKKIHYFPAVRFQDILVKRGILTDGIPGNTRSVSHVL